MTLVTTEDTAAPASPPPTVGRIVHYRLSEYDVAQISARRAPGTANSGNSVMVGEVCAAVVVRTWGADPGCAVNLQVLLDGDDSYWATSRCGGDDPGQWSYPPRV